MHKMSLENYSADEIVRDAGKVLSSDYFCDKQDFLLADRNKNDVNRG